MATVTDPDKLFTFLADGHLWLVVGVAFAFGVLGALIHRASTSDAVSGEEPTPGDAPPVAKPPRPGDFLTGGIAAVAILYVTDPGTGVALIGGSLTAGYAAKTVLAGLESRITSAIARREAVDSKHQADFAKRNLETLAEHVSSLPDSAAVVLDNTHLANVKQLARDMKTQLLVQ